MSGKVLTLFQISGKTVEAVIPLDDLWSQDAGYSVAAASATDYTVYLGPNSSGVPAGKVFHIEEIVLTNRGGTGPSQVYFYREAGTSQPLKMAPVFLGASETFYLDNLKGVTVGSGYWVNCQVSFATVDIQVGGRLRDENTHGT